MVIYMHITIFSMTKLILATVLIGLFLINCTIYATRVPTINDCLIVYTKSEAKSGYIYYFP